MLNILLLSYTITFAEVQNWKKHLGVHEPFKQRNKESNQSCLYKVENAQREHWCNGTLCNHIFCLVSIWMMTLFKATQMRNLVEKRGW